MTHFQNKMITKIIYCFDIADDFFDVDDYEYNIQSTDDNELFAIMCT